MKSGEGKREYGKEAAEFLRLRGLAKAAFLHLGDKREDAIWKAFRAESLEEGVKAFGKVLIAERVASKAFKAYFNSILHAESRQSLWEAFVDAMGEEDESE